MVVLGWGVGYVMGVRNFGKISVRVSVGDGLGVYGRKRIVYV